MKKARKRTSDGMLPEYDFASMKGGVRGKYIKRLRSGSNLALLEPEVAAAFPNDAAVNKALRAALDAASAVTPGRLPNSALQRSHSRVTPRAKKAHGSRRAVGRARYAQRWAVWDNDFNESEPGRTLLAGSH